jgi:hypothetical protein
VLLLPSATWWFKLRVGEASSNNSLEGSVMRKRRFVIGVRRRLHILGAQKLAQLQPSPLCLVGHP